MLTILYQNAEIVSCHNPPYCNKSRFEDKPKADREISVELKQFKVKLTFFKSKLNLEYLQIGLFCNFTSFLLKSFFIWKCSVGSPLYTLRDHLWLSFFKIKVRLFRFSQDTFYTDETTSLALPKSNQDLVISTSINQT